MWGQPEPEGQEGSLSRDNRWKGRGNWERPGLGWPEPVPQLWKPVGVGSASPLSSCATAALSPLYATAGLGHIMGPSSPPSPFTLQGQGSGLLSQTYLVERAVMQRQSFDPDTGWAGAKGPTLPSISQLAVSPGQASSPPWASVSSSANEGVYLQ